MNGSGSAETGDAKSRCASGRCRFVPGVSEGDTHGYAISTLTLALFRLLLAGHSTPK
jgi:hypothetical protein